MTDGHENISSNDGNIDKTNVGNDSQITEEEKRKEDVALVLAGNNLQEGGEIPICKYKYTFLG